MKRQELEDRFKEVMQNAARTTAKRYTVIRKAAYSANKIVVFDLEQLGELAKLFKAANRNEVEDERI